MISDGVAGMQPVFDRCTGRSGYRLDQLARPGADAVGGGVANSGGFTASIDYWSYDFDDRITTTPGQAIANSVANGPGDGSQLVDCASPLVDLVTFQGGCTQGVTTGLDIARVRG